MPPPSQDFDQQEVDELLSHAGISRLLESAPDIPPSLRALRKRASQVPRPVVLSLFAQEVPDLVPESLARAQVLFFALPPAMEQLVPRLLAAGWDSYGELTDHPWTHAVYLALTDAPHQLDSGPTRSEPIVAFRSDEVDLTRAFGEGFLILMFDCAGLLWTRGIPADDDLATSLSACAQSTFQRPLRIHSVRYLQERTRLVEETGADPEGPPNGGHTVLPALSSRLARGKPFDLSQLPEHKKRHLPRAAWRRVSDAVIGWLPEVTHFQEECAGDSALVLKVTAMPEIYRRIESGEFSCVVRLALDVQQCGGPTYVLLVESADELIAVTMPACDPRFRAVYRYWAGVGSCQIAFENFHNGRLHRSRVAWPGDASSKVNPVDWGGEAAGCCRAEFCTAAVALVRERVRERGVCLTCYTCGVADQDGWRESSEDV